MSTADVIVAVAMKCSNDELMSRWRNFANQLQSRVSCLGRHRARHSILPPCAHNSRRFHPYKVFQKTNPKRIVKKSCWKQTTKSGLSSTYNVKAVLQIFSLILGRKLAFVRSEAAIYIGRMSDNDVCALYYSPSLWNALLDRHFYGIIHVKILFDSIHLFSHFQSLFYHLNLHLFYLYHSFDHSNRWRRRLPHA